MIQEILFALLGHHGDVIVPKYSVVLLPTSAAFRSTANNSAGTAKANAAAKAEEGARRSKAVEHDSQQQQQQLLLRKVNSYRTFRVQVGFHVDPDIDFIDAPLRQVRFCVPFFVVIVVFQFNSM